MDEGAFTPPNPSTFGNIDYDLMDQLLGEGCWLQTADGTGFMQPAPSTSRGLSYPSYPLPISDAGSSSLTSAPHQGSYDRERWSSPQGCSKAEEAEELQSQDQKAITPAAKFPGQPHSLCWEGDELNRVLWIAPKSNQGPSTTVQERLMRAIGNLREMNRNRDVLIQIWVPIKRGLKSFLTTVQQPHFFHPTSTRLIYFREVSEQYEFPTDEQTKQAVGLPGRVFLGKVPEWTPNVCFFRHEEYPRVNHANALDVRGSIALPVFERGSGDCLGVVEIIMTTEKINYRPEVESVCKALELVDLQSSEILNISQEQGRKGSYDAILPEILNVLRTVCDTHNLPLAQTWAPCSQQGKGGCWHSDKNALCVSTVDSAFYVCDQQVMDFHQACSEHHLLIGQGGIVGKAFETNQACFAIDVTKFSRVDYPLSHHAKMAGLRAAVAIRLHSIYHKPSDYVLEFYLPSDFPEKGLGLHDRIWGSLSTAVQQHCRSLQFVSTRDLERQTSFPGKRTPENQRKVNCSTPQKNCREETSWLSHVMDTQRKGKDKALSLDFGEEEEPSEEFTLDWSNSETDLQLGQAFSSCKDIKQDSMSKDGVESICGSSLGGRLPLGSKKTSEKRRTKAQKTISLQVLRQYFAGSLKDAAKSIGVCPTTLKRICRQHGITRWPSRKIKKVDHSLRKLQLVIDSVQGGQGAIKLSSFYANFPELNSSNIQPRVDQFSSLNLNDQPKQQPTTQPEVSMFSSEATTSSSPSTSSSQTSTSSHCFPTGPKISPPIATHASGSKGAFTAEDPSGVLKKAQNEAQLQGSTKREPNQLLERSQSNKTLTEHPFLETLPSLPITKSWRSREAGAFKAKAMFGEEKIRFTILPNMGFVDLQQEILKRFNLEDLSNICIKYLDDDKEWVLLTCDADLEECIDIHKSSGSHRIKLILCPASSLGGSLGSRGLS